MDRSAGILLHVTSLPSRGGIGDLGPEAHRYVDWLADAGVGWWQTLPLNPPGSGRSPYSATSTFAGSPWVISPEGLVEDGLLGADELDGLPSAVGTRIDFTAVLPRKEALLAMASRRFAEGAPGALTVELERFRDAEAAWLSDFALFSALKEAHGGESWWRWPEPLARHDEDALAAWHDQNRDAVERIEILQMLFFRQLEALRRHAGERGVRILGDLPFFVALDSAEVWARPGLFKLDGDRRPKVVAGVPPDYFSDTGQLWGNPVYDWQAMVAEGYEWWIRRLGQALRFADAVRLDHFRAFAAAWEVPAEHVVATHGTWVPGPGRALFDAARAELGDLPLVAEDLGEITPDVIELRRELGLPGMAVLHFGFQPEPRSTFIPYAHARDLVVYTGTHDNNTTAGWYADDASDAERDFLRRYAASDGREIHWDLIRLALGSVADLAIVPHQDLVGLGSDDRMNRPGVSDGNWDFRITGDMLADGIRSRLAEMVWIYGRR